MDNKDVNITDTQKDLQKLINEIDDEIEKIKSLPELENEDNADDVKEILKYLHEHPQDINDILKKISE